ncbi:MAG: hypothetical protein LAP13_25350, partial [Acidobacteriia bacterium]|nr:hypothetical protein [Terriglobia bacterium]
MRVLNKLFARPLPLYLGCIGALLYLRLFTLPGTPIVIPGIDQWVYLAASWRMLNGETIYKDFFQFTAPGTQTLYLALFKLFGVHAWIPNAVMILVGLAFAWVLVIISRRVLTGPSAYLPAALFVALSFLIEVNATHHWYSALAVMAAVALTIDARSPLRVAGAGLLCGLAAFFTQTTGALAVLGLWAFLAWECRHKSQNWRWLLVRSGRLLGAFLSAVVTLNAYFVWKAGPEQFLACTVGFMLKYFRTYPINNLQVYLRQVPDARHWYSLYHWGEWGLLHALLPLVYVLFFVRYCRERSKQPGEPWERLVLLNVMGFCLFASVAPGPSLLRLRIVALPPALIVLVWFLRSPRTVSKVLRASLWLGATILIVGRPLAWQMRSTHRLDLPSGRICVRSGDSRDELQWLANRTHPSDYFFDFGSEVDPYVLLQLRNPTKMPFLTPTDFTRPEQVRGVVEALEEHRV